LGGGKASWADQTPAREAEAVLSFLKGEWTVAALTSFEELIGKVRTLPSFPGGVVKLLALKTSDPDYFDSACAIIRADPGLTAQLLRLANSVQFKGQSNAMSVDRAFMRVGSRMVGAALTEGQVLKIFNTRDEAVGRLWAMCALGGSLAQIIAEHHPLVDVAPETAYTFGFLHDIGYLVLLALFQAQASELLTKDLIPSRGQLEREKAVLGVTHTVAGGLVASQWGLPTELQVIIAAHHSVGPRARGTSDVTLNRALDLIALVDDIVYLWVQTAYGAVGGRIDVEAAFASPDQRVFCGAHGLTVSALDTCLRAAIENVESKRRLLGLPNPEPFAVAECDPQPNR
jgi:HD-like signal output (HDOD) protein